MSQRMLMHDTWFRCYCQAFFFLKRSGAFGCGPSVLPGLLQFIHEHVFVGICRAAQSVVGWPHRMEATPVPFAQDPGQHVHFEVELGRKLGADQVRRARAFTSRDQLPAIAVAAVLCCQCGRVAGKRRADAVACRRLVNVQAFLGAAGVAPAKLAAVRLVVDADHGVRHLGRVGAGAAGQLSQHLMDVLLEELALAVEPLLAAVHIFWRERQNVRTDSQLTAEQEVAS